MKKWFSAILLLFCFTAKAQHLVAFTNDSLYKYPNYLKEGWKFISADSIIYSTTGYDDSKDAVVNSSLNQTDSASEIFNGIGWFRLHFTTDSSLTGKPIALGLATLGATEIYIDGKFLKKFGDIKSKSKSTYYDPQEIPFVFFVNDTGAHLIAIRFENFNAKRNAEIYHNQFGGFIIMIGHADKLMYQKDLRSTVFSFTLMLLSGIFLALSLLHLFMFLYHRSDKSNLSFSIFMFSIGATFVILFIAYAFHNPEVELKSRLMLIPVLSAACMALSGFINELFSRKIGWRFWTIVAFAIVTMLSGFFGTDWYPVAAIALVIIVSIEAIISIVIAMFKKVKGAKIIGAGILFLTLFILTVFTLAILKGEDIELNDGTPEGQMLLLFLALAILSTPVSMSAYQAWRFARVNKDLALQLDNVKQLSQKSIEQEQEKQRLLEGRKEELEKEIKLRTDELKESQQQLIHQEKLASLGALTAGIAHEIKNPLNFVNNFSELSNELIDELKESKSEKERDEIFSDLQLNLKKINEHGKRADSIVKNMLQHSRSGTAEKQLTNINQMCDEYLNIAFHGKRASTPEFNCEMIKQFDKNMPEINCVSQDISRVILNLIGNAFDAVRQRESEDEGERAAYRPSVTVITQQLGNKISIAVQDNGNGIPLHIKEKIFEPFFTTKPAGQGTGLGLSLSYDIIKAHGGKIGVDSKENEYTEFVITLPIT